MSLVVLAVGRGVNVLTFSSSIASSSFCLESIGGGVDGEDSVLMANAITGTDGDKYLWFAPFELVERLVFSTVRRVLLLLFAECESPSYYAMMGAKRE